VAGAAGQDAIHAGRARIRDCSRHGVLRTSRAYRARHSRRGLEFEVESNVCGEGCIGVCRAAVPAAVVEASRPTAEGETPSGQPAGCRRYCRDWESEKTGKQISLKAADMKK